MHLSELPTPSLCADLDIMEKNLARMHGFFAEHTCNLRPHFKAHKTPAIARLQAEAGCNGFCAATLNEAEVLAAEGFDDILIANEVCDPAKIDRLRGLADRITLTVAVDSLEAVRMLEDTGLRVLVDVNVGLPRCGATPAEAPDVAAAAADAGLKVAGVMGYEGHVTVMEDADQRAAAARASMEILLDVAGDLADRGHDMGVVSGGSTLSYDVTGVIDGITEVQAGSYVLMDTAFGPMSDFEEALGCLTTVLSVGKGIAVLDAGLKALAVDHGNPELTPDVAADVLFLSDEHTTLATRDGWDLVVGQRLWLRPSHVDPTVNLHDTLYAFRGEDVEHMWPVLARGYRRP